MSQNVVYYIPVHTNTAQAEHTAPFIEGGNAKIFVYGGFNTEHDKMVSFYGSASWASHAAVYDFSVARIIQCVALEQRKIVFLITASTNFGFGRAQAKCFETIKSMFPTKVIDVVCLGHCMFGCESCGLHEHNIPIFFSRYFRKQLQYGSSDMKRTYFKEGTLRCLICPTVGEESFLNDPSLTEQLCKTCKSLEASGKVSFAVKLHGFCWLNDKEKPHPLFSLTERERKSVDILKSNFIIVSEEHYNVLPLMEAADVLIADLSSSIPFESLFFGHLVVVTFFEKAIARKDPEYVKLFHNFSTAKELESLIVSFAETSNLILSSTGEKGKHFFETKYVPVDGKETERISQIRKWEDKIEKSNLEKADATQETEKHFWEVSKSFLESPLDYLAFGLDIPQEVSQYQLFLLQHHSQLQSIPQSLWKKLYSKIINETFDVGNSFQLAKIVYDDESKPSQLRLVSSVDIQKEEDIFLIDHAWTFTPDTSKKQLEENCELFKRVSSMIGFGEEENVEQNVENLLDKLWCHVGKYRVKNPDGTEEEAFFLMDEIGTSIAHRPQDQIPSLEDSFGNSTCENENNGPSVSLKLFIRSYDGMAFSVMFPLRAIAQGEVISRDWVDGVSDPLQRSLLLVDSPYESLEPVNLEMLQDIKTNHFLKLQKITQVKQQFVKHSVSEIQPPTIVGYEDKIKVYTDLDLLQKFLTRPEFSVQPEGKMFDDPSEGVAKSGEKRISWIVHGDVTNFDLKPNQFVNQFPNEQCFCFKNYLARTIEDFHGIDRDWLPKAFDLDTQLPLFASEFLLKREGSINPKNHWIVKPWNLSRGLNIHISRTFSQCALLGKDEGCRVACEYIERPLLFKGRKFDIRFIILVRCNPEPEVSVYNTFWLRFANNPYKLSDLQDYETHFTVMNYSKFAMTHIKDFEFIPQFEEMFGKKWDDVRASLHFSIARCFEAAFNLNKIRAVESPSESFDYSGMVKNPNCTGLYGADMMLTENFEPKLLEMNFQPDCHRACDYDPDFYNKVFGYLFFGEKEFVTKVW
eukprot:TRINITY_DN11799_c0_g1_i2.p1 TRINITY_DN11799_c0_g1~~TRINITY_DN11799_c0_g1_i2.p1  ORF type:complete len:1030 (-),score=262.54 TRINITY_DN11799_c0_g1_i2:30-3119(-)